MKKLYSGKQIVKAGEELIKDDILDREDDFSSATDVLSYWRLTHEYPLDVAIKLLKETTLKKDKNAIFAKRLKRFISIIRKLRRFRKMKLKNMQDIGGCRAIISNQKKLMQVARELRKRPEFKTSEGKVRFKDYIETPKEDGYRGYHLVGQFKDIFGEKKNIEIQLRTNLQHDWATALEIVDLFTGQALKSNQGDEEWKNFFANVSKQFAIMESIHLFDTLPDNEKSKKYYQEVLSLGKGVDQCKQAQDYCRKLKVKSKLEGFAHSLKIIDGRLAKMQGEGYVLIELDTSDSFVATTLFDRSENEDAESMYIDAEKRTAGQKDITVALVSSTAVGGIKEAYPNYFADSTEFLKHIAFIESVPTGKGLLGRFLNLNN
jgi:ppGpp synthetase/RelA/SpoT-type nucleotidyltranferase